MSSKLPFEKPILYIVLLPIICGFSLFSAVSQNIQFTDKKAGHRWEQAWDLTTRGIKYTHWTVQIFDTIDDAERSLITEANSLMAQKQYDKAEVLYTRALVIARQQSCTSTQPEKTFPEKMFPVLSKLAACLDAQGKHREASICRQNIDDLQQRLKAGQRSFIEVSP